MTHSIGERILRETARRAVNRTKNKMVTKTTRSILKQVPASQNPFLADMAKTLTRQVVRTIADLMIAYAGGFMKKSQGHTNKIKKTSTKTKLILLCVLFGSTTTVAGTLPTQNIQLITSTDTISVTAEIADEPAEWTHGLMFRKELPETAGMLFIFNQQKKINMWMKNTLIPLDMLFFDNTGTIVHIAKDRIPLDKTLIPSQQPALGVLEVNGGFADKYKINVGDKIQYNTP